MDVKHAPKWTEKQISQIPGLQVLIWAGLQPDAWKVLEAHGVDRVAHLPNLDGPGGFGVRWVVVTNDRKVGVMHFRAVDCDHLKVSGESFDLAWKRPAKSSDYGTCTLWMPPGQLNEVTERLMPPPIIDGVVPWDKDLSEHLPFMPLEWPEFSEDVYRYLKDAGVIKVWPWQGDKDPMCRWMIQTRDGKVGSMNVRSMKGNEARWLCMGYVMDAWANQSTGSSNTSELVPAPALVWFERFDALPFGRDESQIEHARGLERIAKNQAAQRIQIYREWIARFDEWACGEAECQSK